MACFRLKGIHGFVSGVHEQEPIEIFIGKYTEGT